ARIARATALLRGELGTALASHFTTELYSVGDTLAPAKVDALSPDARRTDLSGALAAIRDRYRGQRVAGVLLLSDGGDTGPAGSGGSAGGDAGGLPVFAVGIGSPDGPRDREVLGLATGDPKLDQASVDLHVTTVSTGFGRAPFALRILANGQLLDTRRIVPA